MTIRAAIGWAILTALGLTLYATAMVGQIDIGLMAEAAR